MSEDREAVGEEELADLLTYIESWPERWPDYRGRTRRILLAVATGHPEPPFLRDALLSLIRSRRIPPEHLAAVNRVLELSTNRALADSPDVLDRLRGNWGPTQVQAWIERHGGNVSALARRLAVPRSALQSWMRDPGRRTDVPRTVQAHMETMDRHISSQRRG